MCKGRIGKYCWHENVVFIRGRHSAEGTAYECNTTVVGSITTRGEEIFYINLFGLVTKKRTFEFHHSTRKVLNIRRKVVNGLSYN